MITNFNDIFGKATVYIVGENGYKVTIPAESVFMECVTRDPWIIDALMEHEISSQTVQWTIKVNGTSEPATLTQREGVTNDTDFYNILEE